MVVRSGNFVQERVRETKGVPTQPLSVESVHRLRADAVVGSEGVLRREYAEVQPRTRREFEQRGREDATSLMGKVGLGPDATERFFRLDEGTYRLAFAGTPRVPAGHVGLVRARGSLRQAGVPMDAGFVGPGDETVTALVRLDDECILVADGATVAELVVVDTPEEA